ncbi:MAG: hypothetical protein KDK45_08650, partial [Leptospiraceae bacterium]|nr:hypothetical protein [Leptospiraceae bacterium]
HQLALIIINSIFLLITTGILLRVLSDKRYVYLFLLTIFISLRPLGADFFMDTWGPYILLMPMFLFFSSLIPLCMGNYKYLLFTALAFTFMLHNHIGSISITIPLLLLALFHYYHNRINKGIQRKEIFFFLSSILLILLLSIPPLIEEAMYKDGNISKILYFIFQKKASQKLIRVFPFIFNYYSEPLKFIGDFSGIWVLAVCWISSFPLKKRLNTPEYYLRRISIAGFIFYFIAASRINGDLFSYLLWHHYIIVASFYFMALLIPFQYFLKMLEFNREHNLQIFHVSWIALVLFLIVSYTRKPADYDNQAEVFMEFIKPQKGTYYKLYWDEQDLGQWTIAASFAIEMVRKGYSPCVEDNWLFMFPRDMKCAGNTVNVKLSTIDETNTFNSNNTLSYEYKKTRVIIKP